ncbi:Na+/proline symporter [Caldalkalibacillus uzonensis]|uniref:Na+/proline symporter n=1 Tax=Caldalkalibacillus uzonensis TaxID=353224 RepID=A0ABU0CWP6_9BACI|nr:hypothetical protein [Caldalkalibacillus uzonensis]MDQ0340533.1 Na+/proline symporter [Caldalkalibacillus uzonensis]
MDKSVVVWGWNLFLLFFAFLAFLTYFGHKKTKGLVDFLAARRSYGPIIVGLALGATTCSAAATMGNPGLVFNMGWPALWYAFGYGGAVVAWAFVAFKLSKISTRMSAKSLPDYMGIRFQSNYMRAITAIVTLTMIYYVAGQFAGTGWIFDRILNIPYHFGVILAGIIIAAYIVIGGTHAEVLNSAIQGVIMLVLALFVTFTVLYYVGTISEINDKLTAQDPNLSWDVVFNNPFFGEFTGPGIMISLALFALTPQLSKMWFTLREERQIPTTLLVGLVFMFFMGLLMWLGGLGARAVVPDVPPDVGVLEMLTKFMPAPVIAMAGVAILAAIMSTTSGLFLVLSIAVANDIFRDLIVPRFKKKMSEEQADRITFLGTRMMIPIVMLVGIIIAFNPPQFLTALMWIGIGAFVGGISPVMIVGSVWRKTTKAGAIVGSTLGFGSYLILYFIMGQQLGVTLFTVPWAGSTVAMIIAFSSCIIVSLFTIPLPEEHLNKIFEAENETDQSPAINK